MENMEGSAKRWHKIGDVVK